MPTVGSQCLDAVESLLARFPDSGVTVKREGTLLEVIPAGDKTFSVSIYDNGEDAMIAAELWHAHYDEPEQLAFCVLWLLTPFYRVVHELKGGVLVAVWIECYEADGWEGYDPVYFLNPEHAKSWEPENGETYYRRYVCQNVLPSPQPYNEICPGAALGEDGFPVGWQLGTKIEKVDGPLGPSLFA